MTIPPDLLLAYQKALYWVRSSPNIMLRIGTISEQARDLLREHDADSAAIITSDNPQSELRSEEENDFYRDQLQQEVVQSQCTFFLTASVDPTGQWPDEHGFLVLDLPETELHRLLRKFDQAAAVCLDNTGQVTLVSQRVESGPESD